MAEEYIDRVAAIAYYTGGSDPFFTNEGDDRWRQYPPPYWYLGAWYYAWPWLWMDGDKDPGWQYDTWEGYLLNRLPVESPLIVDLEGAYDGEAGMGWLGVSVYNESGETLSGTLQCVLTESGLYYEAPNGLDWHHHVMRDMVPTETGTPLTILPGETEYVAHPFFVDASWTESECEFICFVQDNEFMPDSTRDVWQGAKITLTELAGHASDAQEGRAVASVALHPCSPNPAPGGTEITFDLPRECEIRLGIYDVAGRELVTLQDGMHAAGRHVISWQGVNQLGEPVPAGVYFYRLEAGALTKTRRVVITN